MLDHDCLDAMDIQLEYSVEVGALSQSLSRVFSRLEMTLVTNGFNC